MKRKESIDRTGLHYVVAITVAAILCLSHTLLGAEEVAMGQSDRQLKVYDEMRVSTPEMDCDYYMEAFRKTYFNFDYPKIITAEKGKAVVAFPDEKSGALVFAQISEGQPRIYRIPAKECSSLFRAWPVVFLKNRTIHLASMCESQANVPWRHQIRITELPALGKTPVLHAERSFAGNKPDTLSRSLFWGIYPLSAVEDRYILLGRFTKTFFFFPLAIFSGDFPQFNKTFSLLWQESGIGDYQPIELEGRFGARNPAYTVGGSGQVHAAWVRDTDSVSLSSKHNETVCVARTTEGGRWTEPVGIYEVKKTEAANQLRSLSMVNHGGTLYLLWRDMEKGHYFAELKDNAPHHTVKLDQARRESSRTIECLWGAHTSALAVDHLGNIHAFWIINSNDRYQMFLKSRINGQWKETTAIGSGPGTIKLPDMKTDEGGFIHLTYIKGVYRREARDTDFGCYYLKLKREGDGRERKAHVPATP